MKQCNDKEDKLLGGDYCQKEMDNDNFDDEVILLSDMTMLKDEFMDWFHFYFVFHYQKLKNAEKTIKKQKGIDFQSLFLFSAFSSKKSYLITRKKIVEKTFFLNSHGCRTLIKKISFFLLFRWFRMSNILFSSTKKGFFSVKKKHRIVKI